MKTISLIGILSFCLVAVANAADVAQDIEKLRIECDKAVNAAAKPIYLRYAVALDQMLKRAKQANDADAQALIAAEIERVGLLSQTREQLAAVMAGSRWQWFNSPTPLEKSESWMEFYKDGTAVTSWGNKVRWEVAAPSTLRIIEEAPPLTWRLVLNASKREAVADKSAGGEQRSARYLRNAPSVNPVRQ